MNMWALRLAASMVLAEFTAGGQTPANSPIPPDSEIRKILVERVDRYRQSVGLVVGVVEPQGRRIVSYGKLAQGDSRLLTGDTIFEIDSITKVFTSLLLADMVQQAVAGQLPTQAAQQPQFTVYT